MRHLNRGRKLNRTSAHRKALFRNLVLSLIQHERIKTTDAKAKELRRYADRMVTLGKRGDLAARRLAFAFMQSRDAVKKLFDEIAPRFKDRPAATRESSSLGCGVAMRPPLSIIEFSDLRRPARPRSRARSARRDAETKTNRERAGKAAAAQRRPPDHTAKIWADMEACRGIWVYLAQLCRKA